MSLHTVEEKKRRQGHEILGKAERGVREKGSTNQSSASSAYGWAGLPKCASCVVAPARKKSQRKLGFGRNPPSTENRPLVRRLQLIVHAMSHS